MTVINDIAKSNPKDIYAHIFGKPSKSSASELRYRGGLIVTLKGTKKGLWYDFSEGHGGSIIQAIQRERGVDIKEAIAIAADITGVDKSTSTFKNPIKRAVNTSQSINDLNEIKYKKASTKSAISIWNGCVDIKGTLAEKYLVKHRKIIETDNLNIKYWPAGAKWMNVSKDGKVEYKINKTPALVVAAVDRNGEIKAVQRTYLDPKTASKNQFFDNPKLTKGPTKSHFCKLQNGSRGSDLYLAEGVETGSSIAQLKPNDHILVSFGQDNMKNLTDIITKISPRNVYIAADNDGLKSPSKSLEQTIISLQSKGIKVDVLMPDMLQNTTKTDWNDVLKTKGISDFYLEMESKLNAKYSDIDLLKDDVFLAKTVEHQSRYLPNNDYSNNIKNHHSQGFTRELIDREMEI